MTARLTPHQTEVLDRIVRMTHRHPAIAVCARRPKTAYGVDGGSSHVRVMDVGSAGALEHLADKGYLRRIAGYGARSTFTAYVATELALARGVPTAARERAELVARSQRLATAARTARIADREGVLS